MSPALLVHALVAGGSLLALWIYVRLGERRRPASFRRAGAPMALAGVARALAPGASAAILGALFVLAELQRARCAQR